jgi:hypothetical protein
MHNQVKRWRGMFIQAACWIGLGPSTRAQVERLLEELEQLGRGAIRCAVGEVENYGDC